MDISRIRKSKYLTKDDAGEGILATISHITEEDIGMDDQPKEGFVLHFQEQLKPMVLNSTNAQLIAQIAGSTETDHWPGHRIVLYNDPNISFAGKITGGIRVRRYVDPAQQRPIQTAPARPMQPAPRPAPAPVARAANGQPLHTRPFGPPGTPQVTHPASARQVGARPDPFASPAARDEFADQEGAAQDADQDGANVGNPGAV